MAHFIGSMSPLVLAQRRFLQLSAMCLLLLISSASAQSVDDMAGVSPFSTEDGGVYDKVDFATGRIFISLPVRNKAGKLPFSFALTGNFYMLPGTLVGNTLHMSVRASILGGVNGNPLNAAMYMPGGLVSTSGKCYSQSGSTLYVATITDAMGAVHPFTQCTGTPFLTADNGGFQAVFLNPSNPGPNGAQILDSSRNIRTDQTHYDSSNFEYVDSSTVTTTDGNTMLLRYNPSVPGLPFSPFGVDDYDMAYNATYTDSLGQQALTVVHGGPTGLTDIYSYPDAQGASQTLTVTYQNIPVTSCTSSIVYDRVPSRLPVDIKMPTGEHFGLTYVPCASTPGSVTGQLASLTLPNRGVITYGHSGFASKTISRTVTDASGHSAVWQLVLNDQNNTTNSECWTDPLGNDTCYQFANTDVQTSRQQQRLVAQGSAHSGPQYVILAGEFDCYNSTIAPAVFPYTSWNSCSPPFGSNGNTNPNVGFKQQSLGNGPIIETSYDAFGHVVRSTRADSLGTNGYANWQTVDYSNFAPQPNCGGIGIPYPKGSSFLCESVTWDDPPYPSHAVRDVKYTLDAAGHPIRRDTLVSGNTTTGTATYLSAYASYNSNGTLATTTDENGAVTHYYYNGTGGCNNLLLTSTTFPNGLSTSQTWNCSGGVVTSSTDANGKVSTYVYLDQNGKADPLWRMLSSADTLGNITYNTFVPATATVPATQESSLVFNGGSSTVDVLSTLDSLGRSYLSQTRHGPSATSFDTVARGYDDVGRFATLASPCSSAKSMPCVSPTPNVAYDTLGRPVQVTDAGGGFVSYQYLGLYVLRTIGPAPANEGTNGKQTLLGYNRIGQLISVCEMSSGPGSGSCNYNGTSQYTGYLTNYIYDTSGRVMKVTQNAQSATPQQRSFTYDFINRLLTANEPESGFTQYFYDAAPTTPGSLCPGTYNGDLVKKYDANGNTTCYTYDGMHRLTSIKYSGPNATEGNRFLVYDAATVNGVAMANAAGLVAEAYTCCDSKGNKITNLGFSYSARGEVTDVYESTPHSGGFYHTTASYFANGVLSALGGVPGQAAWMFGVDGEGRPNSTLQGTTTLVSSVSYNAASEPLQINYGTGDFDKYTYDAKTALMTYFTFSVGATPKTLVGNLTWNKNGTLRALATTDSFNAANSQNCQYLYDDLVRVTSAQCGSAWSQTFSYDALGNIQKAGSSSFQALYSPTTNRISSLPSVIVTYDANGNLTGDGTHVYSWSAENHQTTVDSTTVTYDALNRPIEIGSGTAYNQILYSPVGKLGIMNGQASKSIYLPLPGGASVNYAAGSKFIRHSDWLGAARLITQYGNRANQYDSAFAPFGENYAGLGTSQLDFTGQTQDTTPGLYDFTYREYSPVQSRWITPDPSGTDAVDSTNPQSWNRYAYLKNNPLGGTDSLGLDDCSLWNFCFDFNFNSDGNTDTISSDWFYWGGGFGASSSDSFFAPGSMAQLVLTDPVWPQANNFVNGVTFVVGGALAVPAAIVAGPAVLATGTAVARTATTYYYASVPAAYAVNALFCELCQGQGFPSITQEWPAGNGFLGGVSQTVIAKPGQLLSRIGEPTGRFVANVGETLGERGMPASYAPATQTLWKIVQPFEMKAGMARPWADAAGYGVQYMLPRSITFLRATGKIKPVK